MIEIFKTNVTGKANADLIIHHIERIFAGYKANFDLNDCDKILRVCNDKGKVENTVLMQLLAELGFTATILPD